MIDYLAGLVECPIAGCEPDDDGWAHGIEHTHFVDRYMVRESDLVRDHLDAIGPLVAAAHVDRYHAGLPAGRIDQAEIDALADLIEQVRSRPGITGADVLADAIIRAGWRRTPKESR